MKFCSANGRSTPEVGSVKRGFPGSPGFFGTSYLKKTHSTDSLRSKLNFYSLNVCRLEQYLLNSNKNKFTLIDFSAERE